MPKISIVMPVYNGEKYLREAIGSILRQTETDFEFLIIDDGSKDETAKIVKSYMDPRIRYFLRPHLGLIATLNFGILVAKGQYVARLDADDIAFPERLEKQLAFMQKRHLILCGTWATKIDEDGREIGCMNYPPSGVGAVRRYSLLHNPFIHPSVIFLREVALSAGGYKNYKHAEDYELWTRIIYKNKADNLTEPLIKYRVHSSQVTKISNLIMRLNSVKVRIVAFFRYTISLWV